MSTRRAHKNWPIVSALVIGVGGPVLALGSLSGTF